MSFREKTTSNGNNLSELTAYSTYRINKDYKLMGYLVAGLSDGSPDFGSDQAEGGERKAHRYAEQVLRGHRTV